MTMISNNLCGLTSVLKNVHHQK